ncbi:hypothetical protein C8R46DRAFT_1343896 [Mycena filopes]|nr:hypothetical protein C8R46DRAFT_1343896 [Mycena filopes]
MPPLTPSDTIHSAHSYWSDSRPVGPTMSIHAAAKPLMRVMYHSQARKFIRRNHHVALSGRVMDVYLGYLAYKYVAATTKVLVLRDLCERVEDESPIIMDSLTVDSYLVPELLASRSAGTRLWTCHLLGRLANAESLTNAVTALGVLRRLVDLVSDAAARSEAIYALSQISRWEAAARGMVEEHILLDVPSLLDASDPEVRGWTALLLGHLASHDSIAGLVLTLNPCLQLVLLSKTADVTTPSVMYALSVLGRTDEGALAILAAEEVLELYCPPGILDPSIGWARPRTSAMLGYLALG